MDIRDEIARLSAEHDKLMREDAQWMAKREAAREALARKSEPDGLVPSIITHSRAPPPRRCLPTRSHTPVTTCCAKPSPRSSSRGATRNLPRAMSASQSWKAKSTR